MSLPQVAIVGRMNVGKSTLFNRLTESNKAIISTWAGTTRDTNRARVLWRGQEFELVDTGGLDVKDDEQLETRVIAAAERAARSAQLVLLVVDGKLGMQPADKQIAKMLRDSGVNTLVLVNKIDNDSALRDMPGNVRGVLPGDPFPVSAKNGRGTGDLLDTIYDHISAVDATREEQRTTVAIIGRPNVGKSSLLNSILGDDVVITADAAHTTRDTNDIPFDYKGEKFLLIDTAGIRKQSKVGTKWADKRLGSIEKHSVRVAEQAIERADVVLLVLEAQKRVTQQDKKIIQLAQERADGLIVVINKWDLIDEKDSNTINEFTRYFDASLPFLHWVPLVFVSAIERLRVHALLDVVTQVKQNFEREISQEDLDEIFAITRGAYKPKEHNMRKYRIPNAGFQSLTQVGKRPPRFYLKAKRPDSVPAALPDIARRELRERHDFAGVKVSIEVGK